MHVAYVCTLVIVLIVVLFYMQSRSSIVFLTRQQSADVYRDPGRCLHRYRFLESYVRTNKYADDKLYYKKQTLEAYTRNVLDFSPEDCVHHCMMSLCLSTLCA